MANSNIAKILTEYNEKRNREISDAIVRKNDIYLKCPRLQEIDDEIASVSIKVSIMLMENGETRNVNSRSLKKRLDALEKEKKEVLKENNYKVSDLEPKYECKYCKDTGYIGEGINRELCNCVNQRLINLEFNNTNIFDLKNQTFDNFNFDLYSDEVDVKKYKSKLSPKENAKELVEIAKRFVENFDDPSSENLLFSGNTGLGKTFLSSCIANEVLKLNKSVLYQTAPIMLDRLIDLKFGRDSDVDEFYNKIYNVDLLIIDDLGTEAMNNYKMSELFNIINSRLLNSENIIKKTIISTNLSLQNLYTNYDERIVSRIVGYYNLCNFYGDDIRFKKKMNNKSSNK